MGFGSFLKSAGSAIGHVGSEIGSTVSGAVHGAEHLVSGLLPHGSDPSGPASAAAHGLDASSSGGGPRLNGLWNHLMGGPGSEAGDGRSLATNHIGNRLGGGLFGEDGPVSNAMRNTPYLGDYWESLAVTHDSRRIHPALLNGLSAVTNVGLTGPLMGLVDAPFRAFGHSLFLDDNDNKHA